MEECPISSNLTCSTVIETVNGNVIYNPTGYLSGNRTIKNLPYSC